MDNESLVNLPDWLAVRFRLVGGDWLSPQVGQLTDYRQYLDLRAGVLHRRVGFVDDAGRRTRLVERRLVHMGDPHLAALELTLIAENWTGSLQIESALDGNVVNTGVLSDRSFTSHHLVDPVAAVLNGDTVQLVTMTGQSRIRVAEVARAGLRSRGMPVSPGAPIDEPGRVGLSWQVDVAQGAPLVLEKVVALYTSRDPAVNEPSVAAAEASGRAGNFDALLADHQAAWDRQWVRLELHAGEPNIDRLLHLHTFHLAQTLSAHTVGLDVGVPARGLHGEGYRCHVFWDEVLVLPFLTFREPELVRELLRYRYRRLGRARQLAANAGFAGAMLPWQSGSDGSEETPTVLFNPRSGHWLPDHSHLQRHVNLAVAYNVWHYYQVTGDLEFLAGFGAEMLIEIARFFASATRFNSHRDRYELRGLIGPDEFHDAYPGATAPGIDNNAYTNIMSVWLLHRVADALRALHGYHGDELPAGLEVPDGELAHWADIANKMFVPFHDPPVCPWKRALRGAKGPCHESMPRRVSAG